jgi:(2R)-3-sulfolactate dehydrogenase (NADP+)
MTRVTCDDFQEVVINALIGAGASADDARLAASALLYAESSGLRSHGLLRLEPLLSQLDSGKINPRPLRTVRDISDAACIVDGDRGMGFPAAQAAVDRLRSMLERSPIAVASVSRSHHLGAAGYYVEQLALRGYVAFATSNTFGAIAPLGGKTPLLGNPPLALAVPRADAEPVVIDMAPAVVARGNIAGAARRSEQIPDTWALDEAGLPTTDPAKAMRGTVRAIGGRKGVLLAMLMDLLLISLTDVHLPSETSSVFTADGDPPELGHVILGINSQLFGITDAPERSARYLALMLKDSDEMRIPGERRREARAAAQKDGLDVDEAIWRTALASSSSSQ